MDLNNLSSPLFWSGVEVGKHFYWEFNDITFHGQVFLVSWFVIALILIFAVLGSLDKKRIPKSWQNLMEYVVSESMTITTDDVGTAPEDTTVLEANVILDVGVTTQGACRAAKNN